MTVFLDDPVRYSLSFGDGELDLNALLGESLSLSFKGEIICIHCGRQTRRSFHQGYCYRCFSSLAQCDLCIMKPEQCHYHEGTCREPEWALSHCMQDHIVYLANGSGVKVGITRKTQIPTRWIDQGAIQALPILKVQSRFQAGLAEVAIKAYVSDRTSWQKMLKGRVDPVDLKGWRDRLLDQTLEQITDIRERFGEDAVEILDDGEALDIRFPVLEYPTKVKSFNLDKNPKVTGVLQGIKGQYLIFDGGVINIRKYGGYVVELRKN
ncbi:MAG: DUF2797 domain-containing protein [Methylococcales bacterium]|jgi:hypothetical protein|nr:DUF2797 domain-containing protein [Methylococcales bacterium]MEE2766542.1 DUF2797 domain-containing protein [Pseudomonadota bacterium]